MVLKRCAYGSCANDSSFANKEQMKGVVFIRFPNAKLNKDKCKRWVDACDRKGFTMKDVTEDTYICSKHFVGGNGPTVSHPDPIHKNNEELVYQKFLDKSTKRTAVETNTRHFKKIKESCELMLDQQLEIANKSTTEISSLERSKICFKKYNNNKNEDTSSGINVNFKVTSSSVDHSLNSDVSITLEDERPIKEPSINNSSSLSVPNTMQYGASYQLVLSKLDDSPNSTGLPILIKVLPSNSTNILPSASVAVIPVKTKKVWMEKLNTPEFCFKWACLGLSVEFSNGNWIFTAINGCLAEKQLKLSAYGEYEVKVLGNSLFPDHIFFAGIANELNEERDFHCLMNQFARWKVCAGNDIVDKIFEDTIIAVRAFVCNLTQTLRSKYCELLVNGNGPIRCKECKILLNRIRRLKYQKRRECEDKNFTDVSENEQSQHSTSDHEIPSIEIKRKHQKNDDLVNMSSFSSDKISMSVEDRSDDDAVPADYLCLKMVESNS